jgi:hypothetical protein
MFNISTPLQCIVSLIPEILVRAILHTLFVAEGRVVGSFVFDVKHCGRRYSGEEEKSMWTPPALPALK